jgi:cell division protein ZipA
VMENLQATGLLLGVGGLFAVALLLAVLRGLRRRRYENIGVSKQAKQSAKNGSVDLFADPLDEDALFGKPRVVGVRDDTDVDRFGAQLREQNRANSTLSAFREPSQNDLQLDADGDQPAAPAAASQGSRSRPASDPQMVIVHLLAERGRTIAGAALRDALLEAGFRYGEMKIFHYQSAGIGDEQGELLFSVANAVNPGSFELREMDSLATPGVTLFLNLTEVADPLGAYDTLIGVVDQLAEALALQVYDESRSSMTRQTIDHCRQRASAVATARSRGQGS